MRTRDSWSAILLLAGLAAGCAMGGAGARKPEAGPPGREQARAEAAALMERLKEPDAYLASLRLGALEPEDPATRCPRVCAAATQVCELAGRICQLAADHPDEGAITELCRDAGPRCDQARETAWKTCECGIPRPASVPPFSG